MNRTWMETDHVGLDEMPHRDRVQRVTEIRNRIRTLDPGAALYKRWG